MLQLGLESSCMDVRPLGRAGGWEGEGKKEIKPRRGIRSVPPGHAVLEWQRGEGWGGGKEQEMQGKEGEKLHWYGLEGR